MLQLKPAWVAIVAAVITLFVIAPLAAADITPTDPPPPNYPPTTGNG
jgi:hypothetical protein